MTTPQIIGGVLPTAYVTVYPNAGVSLSTASRIAPNAAVVVRAPAVHPNDRAGWNLNKYLAISNPARRGNYCCQCADDKQTDAYFLESGNETGTCGDTDHCDKHIQSYIIQYP